MIFSYMLLIFANFVTPFQNCFILVKGKIYRKLNFRLDRYFHFLAVVKPNKYLSPEFQAVEFKKRKHKLELISFYQRPVFSLDFFCWCEWKSLNSIAKRTSIYPRYILLDNSRQQDPIILEWIVCFTIGYLVFDRGILMIELASLSRWFDWWIVIRSIKSLRLPTP